MTSFDCLVVFIQSEMELSTTWWFGAEENFSVWIETDLADNETKQNFAPPLHLLCTRTENWLRGRLYFVTQYKIRNCLCYRRSYQNSDSRVSIDLKLAFLFGVKRKVFERLCLWDRNFSDKFKLQLNTSVLNKSLKDAKVINVALVCIMINKWR